MCTESTCANYRCKTVSWHAATSQKNTKHSTINHLIHFLNTHAAVVAAQHVYYLTLLLLYI